MQTDDDQSSRQPDRILIHAASKIERVDSGGLVDKILHAMVEQMLLALNKFASHGSGWTLDQIVNIEIRSAKAKPKRALSYLALPGKLARHCLYWISETKKTGIVFCIAILPPTIKVWSLTSSSWCSAKQ